MGMGKIVAKAVKSRHRFFTVGVESSVSEAFVRILAERTDEEGFRWLFSPSSGKKAQRINPDNP